MVRVHTRGKDRVFINYNSKLVNTNQVVGKAARWDQAQLECFQLAEAVTPMVIGDY